MSHHDTQSEKPPEDHATPAGTPAPDFARGEDDESESPHVGDFAEGQEEEGHEASDARRGDFAEGQEDLEHTHARPLHGDYAEGQEKTPR
jgi:hypothetical protein